MERRRHGTTRRNSGRSEEWSLDCAWRFPRQSCVFATKILVEKSSKILPCHAASLCVVVGSVVLISLSFAPPTRQ